MLKKTVLAPAVALCLGFYFLSRVEDFTVKMNTSTEGILTEKLPKMIEHPEIDPVFYSLENTAVKALNEKIRDRKEKSLEIDLVKHFKELKLAPPLLTKGERARMNTNSCELIGDRFRRAGWEFDCQVPLGENISVLRLKGEARAPLPPAKERKALFYPRSYATTGNIIWRLNSPFTLDRSAQTRATNALGALGFEIVDGDNLLKNVTGVYEHPEILREEPLLFSLGEPEPFTIRY